MSDVVVGSCIVESSNSIMHRGLGGGLVWLENPYPGLCGTGRLRNPCAQSRSRHSQALTLGHWTGMRLVSFAQCPVLVPTRENTWTWSSSQGSPHLGLGSLNIPRDVREEM